MSNFLGTGVSFDFGFNQYGELKKSSNEDSIEESIIIILSTKIGERMMREDFGCRIHELLFAPNTITTHNLMIYYITEALKKWENRILLKNVSVVESGESSVDIDIEYQVRDTNSFYNLVYPFYLTEQP